MGGGIEYLNIGVGVFVSVVLFIISYRKTIGAKKERINSTYHEIVKMLVRMLVNNNTIPSISEINRILLTKSIENKINITDLPDELTFIYAVYTKIVEDEFLSSDKKKNLIRKINNYLIKAEKKVPSIEDETKIKDKEIYETIFLAFLSVAITASIIFIISSFPFKTISMDILNETLISIVFMGLVLSMLTFVMITKEKQEEIASRLNIIREYKELENEVFKIIKGMGEIIKEPLLKSGDKKVKFDMMLKSGDKKILIEIKLFRNYGSRFIINKLISQAKLAKLIDKDNILILVVNNKKYLSSYINELNKLWDYIFDLNELKEFRKRKFSF